MTRIASEISREAVRLIRRHETDCRVAADESRRRNRRSTTDYPRLRAKRPSWWAVSPGFNPYLARSRATTIGHSVREAIVRMDYEPRPPVELRRAKASGGERIVSVYQVADSAISRMVFESVLAKNQALMSGRAYAYRKDLSSQDAVQYVRSEFQGRGRLFVAEYDFSSYFDRIEHDHVVDLLESRRFMMTGVEKSIIRGFMRVGGAPLETYATKPVPIRERGIPQGTAVSLVLANLAAWEIDRRLERLGVGFVRYADDTLVWSSDYSAICAAAEALHECSQAMGVRINYSKSPGISLLLPPGTPVTHGEIKSIESVDFLGYSLGIGEARIKEESLDRLRSRVQEIIYNNLLREPLTTNQNPHQLQAKVDRDYVTMLLQLRRYLYGDLTEKQVRRYQRGEVPFRRFKGLMAAYPLITDTYELQAIDGWILSRIHLAIKKRGTLLASQGHSSLPLPHGASREELRDLKGISTRHGGVIDLSVPSIRRIATVVQRSAQHHGASGVGTSLPYGY